MTLRYVRVPPGMEEPFRRAEEFVRDYFGRFAHRPEEGALTIGGERYLLVRASALSVEFFNYIRGMYPGLNPKEASNAASSILFDLAHAVGKADAAAFHERMGVTDPLARLSSGPVHFAFSGWALVDIHPESRPSPDREYYLVYDHPNSFEADAWLAKNTPPGATAPAVHTEIPVCFMNAGYSAGWCEQSFGVELTAREILCRARGDACCRFVMAHPARIREHVDRYRAAHPDLFERPRP